MSWRVSMPHRALVDGLSARGGVCAKRSPWAVTPSIANAVSVVACGEGPTFGRETGLDDRDPRPVGRCPR